MFTDALFPSDLPMSFHKAPNSSRDSLVRGKRQIVIRGKGVCCQADVAYDLALLNYFKKVIN